MSVKSVRGNEQSGTNSLSGNVRDGCPDHIHDYKSLCCGCDLGHPG